MSYKSLLKHRCNILGLTDIDDDGSPRYEWAVIASNVRCFLDLSFIRRDKDSQWMEAAGRPQDRSGVWFSMPNVPIKAGYRIQMTRGPKGMFAVEGAIDEIWTPDREHHLELGVMEVATVITRKEVSQE